MNVLFTYQELHMATKKKPEPMKHREKKGPHKEGKKDKFYGD